MADITTNADFLLTVGVDVGLSLEPMQKGLEELVKQLNSKPLLIKFEADTSSMEAQIAKVAGSDSSGKKRQSSAKQTSQAYKEATQAINQYYAKLRQLSLVEKEAFEAYQTTGKTSEKYSALIAELSRLKTAYDNAITGKTAMTAAEQTEITNLDIAKQVELAAAIEQRTVAMQQNNAVMVSAQNVLTQTDNVLARCTKAEHSHKEASREAVKTIRAKKAEVEAARNAVNAASTSDADYATKQENLRIKTNELRQVLKEQYAIIQQNGDATKGLGERLVGLGKKFTQWFGVSQLIMAAYRAIRKMITAVKELDTAMTELKKVTDETDETYQRFLENASTRAKKLGASLTDVVKTTADFARLGFSLEDAEVVSDAALVYKNVGDGIEDIDQASESLISTMQAFGVEAKDVMSIVDKFNTTGNKFAISSGGVGDALLNSAAALNAAGNSLDESIGLITAANTTIQNPEKVGTALKTVSMYLRAAKTEAEDAGESTDGMANSVSELRGELLALTGNRVDIQIDEDNFKSTYEILKELSKVWDDLSDISQANITEMIGGKRNANVISALLKDFEKAENVVKQTTNSAGSALEENEKVLDSIQGKLNVLSATFETFAQNLIGSDTIKFFVDFATGVLSVLDAFARLNTLLPAVIGNFLLFKAVGVAKNLADMKANVSVLTTKLLENKSTTAELTAAVYGLTLAEKQELVAQLNKAVEREILTETEKEALLTELGLVGASTSLTIANKGLATSFKSVMASIPVWGWIALAITVVIEAVTGLVSWLNASTKSIEDLEQEYQNLNQTITNTVNNYKSIKTSTEEIIPRFAELAEGVDEFGNQVELTDEEYAEFLELNNKIAELFPELNLGMDENGNAMLALSYSADTLTQSLNDLIEAERTAANETVAKTMGDTLDNINDTQKAYNKEITKTETELRKLSNAYNTVKEMGESYKWDSSNKSDRNPNRYKAANYKNALDALGIEYTETEVDFNPTTRTYNNTVIKAEIDWDALERQYANGAAGYNATIERYNNKIDAQWEKLRKSTVAYAQLDAGFQELDTDMQTALTKIIGSINWEDTGLKKEDDIKDYLSENFLNPIYEAEPEIQNALLGLFQLKSAYDGGQLYVNEYKKTVDVILEELKASGMSDEAINAIKLSIDVADLDADIKKVKDNITGTAEEIEAYLNELTGKELAFAIKIIEEEGSMSIDELQQKIDKMRFENASYIEPFDFTSFIDGLNSAVDGVDSLASAMQKLKEGTALTKNQLMDLVEQYPQLLKNSNLFTDGSIEGQQKMLQAILDTYEAEYDAHIDTKIAELEATYQVLEDQLALETDKANIILELENMSANGQLDQKEELINKIAELNDLQGQNFVKLQNGELQVNEEALNDKLSQDTDYAQTSTENIWAKYGNKVVETHNQAYNNSLSATGQFAKKLLTRVKNIGSMFSGLGNLVVDVFSGNYKKGSLASYFSGITDVGGVDGGNVEVYFGDDNITVDGKNIDDWITDQRTASNNRISAIEKLKTETLASINNLKDLKGLKLTDIYASSSSKSGSSDKDKDEENIFKTMYEYHQHLVEMEQETTAEFLKWLDDAYKAAYKQGEITLDEYYKYEEEVFKGMRELRDEAKDTLEELIEFRVDMLKQDIENEKEALDKKLDNLKEFYDKQKEMLQDQYDEEKRLEEQSEKRKAVSDIRAELSMLENDDSAWAQKRKLELQAELSDAEGELADFEKESALDKALNAIDEAYNSQEAQLEREMEALDEKLNDPNALYNQALNDIRNNSKNQLYYQMLMYNRQYGDGKDETVKELWESTYGALDEYEKMFGELYQGVDLKNETGYKPTTTTTTNTSSNKTPTTTTTTTPKTETKKEDKPSLEKGSYVKVKSGTRWYADSYGGGASGTAKAGTIKYINTKGSHPYNIDGLGWVKKSDIVGYASGTKHATAGLHELYEQGAETLFISGDGSKYRILNNEDKVLNAKATNFLYDFANGGENALAQMLKNVFGGTGLNGISPTVINNEINMGDIIVRGDASTKTVSEIRREQRSSVDYMLRELNKLNK